jgi:ATP-dependent RNA helicase RhlE
VLIRAPTRELAAQIGESVTTYGRHLRITRTVIYGGVKQHTQVSSLEQGKHIVIATPGRLIDLMQQKHVSLDSIETFVLDEADRMLDMGFLPDIRRVISALPQRRQSLFFSATLSPTILELANTLVHSPVRIEIAPEQPAVERIVQKVLFVNRDDKDNLLVELLSSHAMNRVIVFTQMKHVANKVARKLNSAGISAEVIHGNKSQNARISALEKFKQGEVRVLVATDIAARGIDVDSITHVVNYDLPLEPETYVHRIGRTARAGTEGDAISFCSAQERDFLRAIEKLILIPIPQDTAHSYHDESARNARGADARPAPRGGRGERGGRDNGRERANLLKPIKYSSGPKWRRSGSN